MISPPILTTLRRMLCFLAGAVFLAAVLPQRSMAQLAASDTLLPWPREDGIRGYGMGQRDNADVDPDLIVFNDTTPTATVTLINPLATSRPLWIAPECGGDGHVQPDDPLAAAWHHSYPCAVPWLSGYPQYLILAPHERRTILLHLVPPPTLPDGRYRARLMINGITWDGSSGGGHDETAVEYVKGLHRPRLARNRWAATGQAVPASTVVQADPTTLVLGDTTTRAQVTLTNPGATATEVWLTMDCPWFRIHYDTVPGYTHKSQYEFTWHLIEPNIVTWLSGYPQHLVFAPHERQTFTLELHPFLNLPGAVPTVSYPAGSYYAQLRYVQTPVLTVTGQGDTTFATAEGAIDVVYHIGAESARPLTLSPVQYTRQADGTADVCVTVQQPGLGVVVGLHVAVQADTGPGPGGPSRWSRDTTVAVWEIWQHHANLTGTYMGIPVHPGPVCVALPTLLHGRYRLQVSAHSLGGDRARDPGQTTPIEVP